jgi:hypothetical protein
MEYDNSTIEVKEDIGSVHFIMFILLLIVEIPSILCTCFILIFFFFNWHSLMTKGLRNHVIFLLIVVSLLYITLDLPFIISYYHLGYDRFRTPSFCLWWYWLDYTVLVMSLILTATASVQRHILIFNSHCLRVRRKRWLFHFIPLIYCVIYPPFFYMICVFFYPCITTFDESNHFCSTPCYASTSVLYYFDWMFNTISPLVIIVAANITLVWRVICSMRKIRQRQSRTWQKQKKLTLQLLAFSSLYIVGWGPSTVISILEKFFFPKLFDERPDLYYINNSSYFVCPLQPLICFFALPDLAKFIKSKFGRRQSVRTIQMSKSSE